MKGVPFSVLKKAHVEKLKNDLSSKDLAIAAATQFVKEIEKGNLDFQYQLNNQDDNLASSLVSMRDQMKNFAAEERQRNWATEGLAKFVEDLRSKDNSFIELSDNIIHHLVKYMGANQGALYLINDDDPQDTFLEMVSCFAYERKKDLHKRIEIGSGIIGQVVLEKTTTYMTAIPKDYIKITSGLGASLPRNLLIVPLKLNDIVFGVVELAAFETIKPYRIEFVEKLGESIASTISAVKIAGRTKRLLQETQQHTEEMKSQEEEMRQSMEELSATQEEMQRILTEVQSKEGYLNELINATDDLIYTVDKDYKLVSWNKGFAKTLEQFGMVLEKGSNTLEWYPSDEEKKKQMDLYDRALRGETFELATQADNKGTTIHFLNVYAPLRNISKEIFSVAVFGKNITEMAIARQQSDKLMKDAQNQAEELKTQEEELLKASKAANELQLYYNDVIEGMVDCVLTIDADYKIVVANSAFKRVFSGYGLSVEPGSDLLAMAKGDPIKEAEFKKPYIRAFAGEHVEEPHRHHFDLDFQVSYNPLKNNAGDVIGVSLIAREITQRLQLQKQTEELLLESQQQSEELKAQEEELRQNMEELSATQEEMTRQMTEINRVKDQLEVRESIFGHTTILSEADLHGTITVVNDKLCEVSKYSREELIGQPHNVFRHPDMPQELFKIFWQTIKKGEVFKGIIKNKAKDGSHYWVDASIVPVKDDKGKIVKYIGARYHITDDEIALMMYNKQAKNLKLPVLEADSLELAR